MKLLQFQAKESIEHLLLQQLPDSRLEVLENPQSLIGFAWEEKGKEFHYNGEMYDVVREKQVNGNTFIYCVTDRKESKIYNCLEVFANRQLGDTNTTTGSAHHYLIRLLAQVYILSGKQEIVLSPSEKLVNFIVHNVVGYPHFPPDIASPPPKLS